MGDAIGWVTSQTSTMRMMLSLILAML